MTFRSPTRLRNWTATGIVLAGLGLSVALVEYQAPSQPASAAPGTAAMRVAIDPETGQLVHAPVTADKALDPELSKMLSRSSDGLVEVHHPDGSVSVDLQGRFMSASLARINDDGRVETTCLEDEAPADAFLTATDPQPEVR